MHAQCAALGYDTTVSDCQIPASPPRNGRIDLSEVLTYSCDPGFRFTNNRREFQRSCRDGSWSESAPDCVARRLIHVTTEMPWRDAWMNCQDMGGDLASIHSQADQDKAQELVSGAVFPFEIEPWIGLKATEGKYEWTDGTSVSYQNWAPGAPGVRSDCCWVCGYMRTAEAQYKWNNWDCSSRRTSICFV